MFRRHHDGRASKVRGKQFIDYRERDRRMAAVEPEKGAELPAPVPDGPYWARHWEPRSLVGIVMGDPIPSRAGRVPLCEDDQGPNRERTKHGGRVVPVTLPRVAFLERITEP